MSNLLWRLRTLAFKLEANAGVPESLVAADGACHFYNGTFSNDIEEIARDTQGGFAYASSQFGKRIGSIKWRTHIVGGSTLPFWSNMLIACGWVPAGRVFTSVSQPPGAGGVKTATIALYTAGKVSQIRGAMGTFQIVCEAGRPSYIDWTFVGGVVSKPDAALIVPTYPTEIPLRFVKSALTVGSWQPKVSRLTIDAGNVPYVIEDSGSLDDSGVSYACVGNRRIVGTLDPEATLNADHDLYGDYFASAESAFSFGLGNGEANGVQFNAPQFQITRANEANRNGLQTDAVAFALNGNGSDNLSIVFGIAPVMPTSLAAKQRGDHAENT